VVLALMRVPGQLASVAPVLDFFFNVRSGSGLSPIDHCEGVTLFGTRNIGGPNYGVVTVNPWSFAYCTTVVCSCAMASSKVILPART
jgi:hypothetical protein